MGLLKDFKEMKKQVDEVHDLLDKTIIFKAKKYDEIMLYLKNISLDLKIDKFINELGEDEYKLTYSLPSVNLRFDEKGELQENLLFTSINMLDLISVEDIQKLLKIISEEKNKKS